LKGGGPSRDVVVICFGTGLDRGDMIMKCLMREWGLVR